MLRLRFSNHLMWVLPLVTGVVVYGLAVRQRDAGQAVERKATVSREPTVRDLKEALTELEEAEDSHRENLAKEVKDLSGEELRQRLTLLMEAKQHTKSGDQWRAVAHECDVLAREIGGREGEAGVHWLLENLPGAYNEGMTGWAAAHPDAALAYVIASDLPKPCSNKVIIQLLNQRIADGGDALKDAVEQVPWEKFDRNHRDDLYGSDYVGDGEPVMGLKIPDEPELKAVWQSSGALRIMAEQGVDMRDAFDGWFERAPEEALTEWASWPWPPVYPESVDWKTSTLRDWLEVSHGDDENDEEAGPERRMAEVARAISATTPDVRSKVLSAIKAKWAVADYLRARFPEVQPAEPAGPEEP